MRILVTGGRTYDRADIVANTLGSMNPTVICQGGARGADALALEWAKQNNLSNVTYPADWKTHGKAAGAIRNVWMLEDFKPDIVLAFPGGPGTAHMCAIARKAGYQVRVVNEVTERNIFNEIRPIDPTMKAKMDEYVKKVMAQPENYIAAFLHQNPTTRIEDYALQIQYVDNGVTYRLIPKSEMLK